MQQYATISSLSVQQSKLSPRGAVDNPMTLMGNSASVIHSTEGVIVLTVTLKGMYLFILLPNSELTNGNKNIIPRNMIIKLGCASVDNHIPRDDIFDYLPMRECNIYTMSVSERGQDITNWPQCI